MGLKFRKTTKASDLEELYLEHRDLIERAARFACRGSGLPPQDVEDFAASAHLKIVTDDYAVLRFHRGEASSLASYLNVVIQRHYRDFLIARWGKYRPSAEAKRLGESALRLEWLLVRERHDLEIAVEIMLRNDGSKLSADEIRDLAARLRPSPRRRIVGEEALEQRPADVDTDRRVEDRDRERTARRVEQILAIALAALSARDLLLLKMFYRSGMTIARIAAVWRCEQRPLYTRKNRCLKRLKGALEKEGLTWAEVQAILGWKERDLHLRLEADAGKTTSASVFMDQGDRSDDPEGGD